MSTANFRKQLHQQIESLPDEIVQQIADFTFFVMARRDIAPLYEDWTKREWQDFSPGQFLRDTDDEVEYTLGDSQEIYHP